MGFRRERPSYINYKNFQKNGMTEKIKIWKAVYKGYYESWHDLHYQTIAGRKSRKMDTLNMAKTVASEMASLVFNEKCEISISDEQLGKHIQDILQANQFNRKFQDYLEYCFALGGMVVKPYFSKDAQKIKLSYVTAECFIPLTWRDDEVTEAIFTHEFTQEGKTYVHLECHTWEKKIYVIHNEVYETNQLNEMVQSVPLNKFFPGIEQTVHLSGLTHPLFTYFRPNTANNLVPASPLGISLYANALDTMRTIDTVFDSLHREFRLGKKRIIVPAAMIKAIPDQQTGQMHRYFDDHNEIYEALYQPSETDSNRITDISVDLRTQKHVDAINALLNLFAMQTGFSVGAFSFDGHSMKTATEVISEQSKTFKSKQSHEVIVEEGITHLIQSIVVLADKYQLFTAPQTFEVAVSFDDSIAEDKAAEIHREIEMVTNKLQSKLRAMMRIHGLTEAEAQKLRDEINDETQTATAEVVDMFGFSRTEGDEQ